jgi:hypothetical protein
MNRKLCALVLFTMAVSRLLATLLRPREIRLLHPVGIDYLRFAAMRAACGITFAAESSRCK